MVISGDQPLPIYVDLTWSRVWTVENTKFDGVITNNDKASLLKNQLKI